MDAELLNGFMKSIAASSPVAALLLVAIRWLVNNQNSLIEKLDEERKERINDLDKRIEAQEEHIRECNEDRKELHRRFDEDRRELHYKISEFMNALNKGQTP